MNSIDFLNISLLCLDEGATTFFLVQAYSLAVRTVNLRCVFPLRPLDTFLWQRQTRFMEWKVHAARVSGKISTPLSGVVFCLKKNMDKQGIFKYALMSYLPQRYLRHASFEAQEAATGGTFQSAISGTFVSDTGGTFIPILSNYSSFEANDCHFSNTLALGIPKGDACRSALPLFKQKEPSPLFDNYADQ